jgi:hypothetical protein
MAGLSLRLPEELESRLDEEAQREGVAWSEVARTAIAEFSIAESASGISQRSSPKLEPLTQTQESAMKRSSWQKKLCRLDQPRALDRGRVGDGPLTILTRSELAAVERGLRVVLGMYSNTA